MQLKIVNWYIAPLRWLYDELFTPLRSMQIQHPPQTISKWLFRSIKAIAPDHWFPETSSHPAVPAALRTESSLAIRTSHFPGEELSPPEQDTVAWPSTMSAHSRTTTFCRTSSSCPCWRALGLAVVPSGFLVFKQMLWLLRKKERNIFNVKSSLTWKNSCNFCWSSYLQ